MSRFYDVKETKEAFNRINELLTADNVRLIVIDAAGESGFLLDNIAKELLKEYYKEKEKDLYAKL